MFSFIFKMFGLSTKKTSGYILAHKNMTQAGFVVLALSLWTNVAIIHFALRLRCSLYMTYHTFLLFFWGGGVKDTKAFTHVKHGLIVYS